MNTIKNWPPEESVSESEKFKLSKHFFKIIKHKVYTLFTVSYYNDIPMICAPCFPPARVFIWGKACSGEKKRKLEKQSFKVQNDRIFEGVHLTLLPHILSVQVKFCICYITSQWGRVQNKRNLILTLSLNLLLPSIVFHNKMCLYRDFYGFVIFTVIHGLSFIWKSTAKNFK